MASTPNTKVFDVINDRIIKMLDEGIVPWRKPWTTRPGIKLGNRPRNVDGRPYSGLNAFFLNCLGYSDPRFLTYKKAESMGGMVRKGEHGVPVVFWKQLVIEVEDPNTGEKKKKRVPMLRYFTVFNVEQCDGLTLPALPTTSSDDELDTVYDENLVLNTLQDLQDGMPNPPRISHVEQDRAYYTPAVDAITLPKVKQFASVEGYAETLCHELSHSTGHKTRLNRDGIDNLDHFGSDRYAREELVAEFGAAFLMASLGIETPDSIDNMAAYVAGWKQRIKEDPKALVVAAGRGEKAAQYILGEAQPVEEEQAA